MCGTGHVARAIALVNGVNQYLLLLRCQRIDSLVNAVLVCRRHLAPALAPLLQNIVYDVSHGLVGRDCFGARYITSGLLAYLLRGNSSLLHRGLLRYESIGSHKVETLLTSLALRQTPRADTGRSLVVWCFGRIGRSVLLYELLLGLGRLRLRQSIQSGLDIIHDLSGMRVLGFVQQCCRLQNPVARTAVGLVLQIDIHVVSQITQFIW